MYHTPLIIKTTILLSTLIFRYTFIVCVMQAIHPSLEGVAESFAPDGLRASEDGEHACFRAQVRGREHVQWLVEAGRHCQWLAQIQTL